MSQLSVKQSKLKNYLLWQKERGLAWIKFLPQKAADLPGIEPGQIEKSNPNQRVSRFLFLVEESGVESAQAVDELLTRIVGALKLSKEDVCIHLVAKDKIADVLPDDWLHVVAFGEYAQLRAQVFVHSPVLETLHPLQMMENPTLKRNVWQDLQILIEKSG